jgi:hypothetical protein
MLTRYWFKTQPGLGYGVTASNREEAESILASFGYPRAGEKLIEVVENVAVAELDPKHVLPNAGPSAVKGVWFPMHNV